MNEDERKAAVMEMEFTFKAAQSLAPFFRGTNLENSYEGLGRYIEHLISIAQTGLASPEAVRILSRWNERQEKLMTGIKDPDGQQYFGGLRWLGMWGACGTPVVRLEPAWAASMCMTSIPKEMYEYVIPPWPAFLLEIPSELGITKSWKDKTGERVLMPLRYVKVARMKAVKTEHLPQTEEAMLRMIADSPEGPTDIPTWDLWHICVVHPDNKQQQTLTIRVDDLCGNHDPEYDADSSEVRGLRMMYPLIGALCMAARTDGAFRKASAKALRSRNEQWPTTNQYVAGAPVKIDLRMKVRAFIERGRKAVSGPLTIQTMVRGHWKNQPHGQARSERKFIHIEPYWRGLEDAPIVVRPHLLG